MATVLMAVSPATAVAASPFALSGSATVVSDYRLRGISRSSQGFAVQGVVNLSHASGFYGEVFASNVAGWGGFGGADFELDLVGGYRRDLGAGTIDAGVIGTVYPGAAPRTDYAEVFARMSGTIGPVWLLAGVTYAPKQQALGNWYHDSAAFAAGRPDAAGSGHDNLYLRGDSSWGVTGLPLTLKGHIGHSDGNPGLGPNGSSLAPTGHYWDWLIGADVVLGRVTLGLAYVDTDIDPKSHRYRRLQPEFSGSSGSNIAGATGVVSLTYAF